jgi:DNA-binding MarR family transcriptional regulator
MDVGTEYNDQFGNGNALPVILIFSDTVSGEQAAIRAAQSVRGRVAAALPIEDANDRLDSQIAVDAILVEIAGDHPAWLDRLLGRIEQLAVRDRVAAIITAPLDMIDRVSASISASAATLLCAPEHIDRSSALGLALGSKRVALGDVAAELDSERLRRLADEVSRIARTLSKLSSTVPAHTEQRSGVNDMISGFSAEPDFAAMLDEAPDAAQLRMILRLRRLREQYFATDLFADPAWDMLLDLMAARVERVQVAVSSLCIAAAVPPTTALRWIKTMTDQGLFERVADPDDGRRIFIQLSQSAAAGISRYLSAAKKIGGLII